MIHGKNNVSHEHAAGRLHALDNLRAILALLGIPFHACLLLLVVAGHRWVSNFDLYALISHAPPQSSAIFLAIFFLHIFRMPAFFLLAGFFAHFIYERSNVRKLLTNRLIRIGLPLVFIIIWLYPIYLNLTLLAASHESLLTHQNLQSIFFFHLKNDWADGRTWSAVDNTRDAWFLDYLLWCYVITLLLLFVKQLHPFSKLKPVVHHWVRQCLFTRARYVIFPLALTLLMLTAHPSVWVVAYNTHLKPSLTLLAFYSVWYFLGWWLWDNHRDFSAFMKNPGYQMLGAVVSYLFYLIMLLSSAESNALLVHGIGLFFYMLTMILGVFGLVGLSWRYLHAQSWLSYISASSYWVYLVQMPILVVSIPYIGLTHWPFFVQLIANTVLCTLLCLFSYYILVRPTWLHRILGG